MHDMMKQAEASAAQYFGNYRESCGKYGGLRLEQKQYLSHIFSGRDGVVIMPTGSGKSVSYVIPALVRPGLVVVISPLIALIKEQASILSKRGVFSVALHSHLDAEQRVAAFDDVTSGVAKVLFISPERLGRLEFRQWLRSLPIQLLAIDEAHCISQWGQSFRPDYRWLGGYLREFQGVQKIALTATATPKVKKDIIHNLELNEPFLCEKLPVRENLQLKVIKARKVSEQFSFLLQAVMEHAGQGIVYVPTRKTGEQVLQALKNCGKKAALYHAGLEPVVRSKFQTGFMRQTYDIMVATHAFGMGIDKSNIRFVHHMGLPGSIEQYIQETGRAGRDGLPASCWLIYTSRDYHIQKFMAEKTLPPTEDLFTLFGQIKLQLEGRSPQSYDGVLAELQRSNPRQNRQALIDRMQVLIREGAVLELRHSFSSQETLLELNGALGEEFFETYESRRLAKFDGLEHLRLYLEQPVSKRFEFFCNYFGATGEPDRAGEVGIS